MSHQRQDAPRGFHYDDDGKLEPDIDGELPDEPYRVPAPMSRGSSPPRYDEIASSSASRPSKKVVPRSRREASVEPMPPRSGTAGSQAISMVEYGMRRMDKAFELLTRFHDDVHNRRNGEVSDLETGIQTMIEGRHILVEEIAKLKHEYRSKKDDIVRRTNQLSLEQEARERAEEGREAERIRRLQTQVRLAVNEQMKPCNPAKTRNCAMGGCVRREHPCSYRCYGENHLNICNNPKGCITKAGKHIIFSNLPRVVRERVESEQEGERLAREGYEGFNFDD